MKAHPNEQLKLLELAKLDAAFARLQHLAKHLPEQEHLVAIEQDRRARRAATATKLGELEDLQRQLQRVRDDLDTVAQRREQDQAAMNAASEPKIIAGYERELAALERREERLTDEGSELESQVAQAQAAYDEAHSSMRELETLASDLLERRELAKQNLKKEAQELHTARGTLSSGIDAELLAVYEDRRKRVGIGAAELIGNVSSASNEVVETADMVRMRACAADEIVFCPHTDAILIRTDRSDV